MTSNTEQRILIALDARETTEESLVMLAAVAGLLHAPLAGLFVEDTRLSDIAKLPFITEINRTSAREQSFHAETLTALNRNIAGRVHRLLDELSRRYKVPYTFRAEPGELISKALTQEGVDVFFPARKRALLQPKGCYSRQADQLKITLIYDRSPQFERALEIVRLLAQAGGVSEVVLVCDTDIPEELVHRLPGTDVRVKVHSVRSVASALRECLCQPTSTLLLVPKHRVTYEELSRLFNELATPLLLLN
ncbi:MAG: hypothetical protein R3E62_03645 [Pseudomonadales bacterium]